MIRGDYEVGESAAGKPAGIAGRYRKALPAGIGKPCGMFSF